MIPRDARSAPLLGQLHADVQARAAELTGAPDRARLIEALPEFRGIVAAHRGIKTGGLYRAVRHPIYAAYLLAFGGFVLAHPSGYNTLVLLIWAGIVEAFVSQYHQPVLPYGLKIAFGLCELAALSFFLGWAGRE